MLSPSCRSPELPGIFSVPFRFIPTKQHSKMLCVFLNKIFSQQIKDGDLDFLEERRLCIKITDTQLSYYIGFLNKKLVALVENNNNDLLLQACVYDFLSLAARQEDPDTLVFQRKLVMQGDTELGLELKNFLDGLELDSNRIFTIIESVLNRSLPLYKRLFSRNTSD